MPELPTTFDAAWPMLAAALVALARPLGLASTAPGWSGAAVGPRLRLMLAIALAAVVTPLSTILTPSTPLDTIDDAGTWLGLLLIELAIGLVLGLTGALVLAAARQAGEMVGLQAGMSPASLLDPEAASPLSGDGPDGPLNPVGHLYGLIALGVFLSLDGPLRLVEALAGSYRAAPPGLGLIGGDRAAVDTALNSLVPDLFGRIGATLGLTLRAAAPAGVGTLLAGVALAVLARSAGARPFSGLAWPLRAALGAGLVLLTLGTVAGTLAAAWNGWTAEFVSR